MAEALGVASGVAGLVSLGLEVVSGIESYIDAVKSRKEELATASTSVRNMRNLLDVLRVCLPSLSARHQAASSAATFSIKACEEELGGLSELLQDLLDLPAQKHGIRGSIKQQKKALSYPFHRQNLDKLQRRLSRANNVLRIAMQTLEL